MKLLRFFAAIVCWSLAFQAFALPQNDAAQPKRVRIELLDALKLRIHVVEAEFPPNVPDDRLGGPAFLSIVINRQGKVIEAALIPFDEWPANQALGEDPRLREAAVKAVKQWEYRPYLLNGEPVEVETQVAVPFKTRHSAVIAFPGGVGSSPDSSIGGVPGGVRGGSGGVINGLLGSAAPPPKVAVPRGQRVSSEVLESNLLKHDAPVYPPMARIAKIQGEVRLYAVISKTGAVENVRGVSGHPLLIQPAMDAVRKWQYKPFLLNGEPVEAEGEVIVVFKL